MVCARVTMNFIWNVLLGLVFAFSVAAQTDTQSPNIVAGYVPGRAGMLPINTTNCRISPILDDPDISDALECARTCHSGDEPKICYYNFVIERYPTNGQACALCTPNISNSICPDCQCVPTDGVERTALTVNRMIPGPSIQVCAGDTVVIDVTNRMKEDSTSIHWHGLFQKDTQYYDGVPLLTQCPIEGANTFRYHYIAKNSGTHFWHAHKGLNKMDGIFGTLIVRDPIETDPQSKYYQTDLANHVVIINDWMNMQSTERFPGINSGFQGQLPDSLLINGRGQFTNSDGSTTNSSLEVITVEPNTRHRFRLVNSFCTTCGGQLTIENHTLTIIAVDGQNIKPVVANSIVSFAGERYDFVINTNQTPGSYWIQLRGLEGCEPALIQQLAILRYANTSGDPSTPRPTYYGGIPAGIVVNALDVRCQTPNPNSICISQLNSLKPVDDRFSKADYQFILPIRFNNFDAADLYRPNNYQDFLVPVPDVAVAATVGNITFEFPPSPPLSQLDDLPSMQFCNTTHLSEGCNETCICSHLLSVKLNTIVEIVLLDATQAVNLSHPFHLHGYAFHVVAMDQPLGPSSFTGNATAITPEYVKQLDSDGKIKRNLVTPPGKDTIAVPNNGYVIFRFYTDNPGFWLFHCHFVYHQVVGMEVAIRVGDKSDLPPVPQNFPKCGNFQPSIKGQTNNTSGWHEVETGYPFKPGGPLKPGHQFKSGRCGRPFELSGLWEQGVHSGPINPNGFFMPGRRCKPSGSMKPGRPFGPSGPLKPGRPFGPSAPQKPGRPFGPSGPLKPGRPF